MKESKFLKELLLIVMVLTPLVYLTIIWKTLPEIIPIHFDAEGNPNNFGSKNGMALTQFFLNMGIYILLRFVPKMDPMGNFPVFSKSYFKLRFIITLFFSIISFSIIFSALNGKTDASLIFILIALLISIVGNYMSTIKPNYFVGIRTPWTLEDEIIWKRTHQLSGKFWFFGGLLLVFVLLFVPHQYSIWLFLGFIFALAIIPFVYSYFLFSMKRTNKHKNGQINNNENTPSIDKNKSTKVPWRGPIYFNPRDSRLLLPKRYPGIGWTFNFGNPYSYLLIIALILTVILSINFTK